MRVLVLIALSFGVWACAGEDNPSDSDGDADADADVDGDVDADGDADADADGDADGDADADADADPHEEECNGEDDDQDGEIDEGNPGSGFFCRTAQPGICSDGSTACVDGALECQPTEEPRAEDCSNYGRDDDCNGTVDDIEGFGDACDTGLLGICAPGTIDCADGAPICVPDEAPVAEVCPNLLDDDCNGEVDDGIVLVAESCANNGRDDDCNGAVDDIAGFGDACDTGLLGICGPGAMACDAGQLVCRSLRPPGVEQCPNGDDDDCDGEVDEGIVLVEETCANPRSDDDCNGTVDDVPGEGDPCDTGVPGICGPGIGQCDRVDLVFECIPDAAATEEICGSLEDEDCDGEVDEAECLSCEVDALLDEVEPNDEIDMAQTVLCIPVTISASHGGCDADVFEITVVVDGTYAFETTNGCGNIDTTLWLYDEDGVELDMNDDSFGLCSLIEADLAAGTYFIREYPYDAWVGDVDCREGNYDLEITQL